MSTFTAPTSATRVTDRPTLRINLPEYRVEHARLYPIPETRYVPRQRAGNTPVYHLASPEPEPVPMVEPMPGYLAREAEKFRQASKQLWRALKAIGRDWVHRTVRWIVLPLAIISSLGVVAAEPAELPANYFQTEAGQ